MLSTEFQLAIECCRRRFAPGDERQLSELARAVDWTRFLSLVRRHRVQALVWQSLVEAGATPPAAVSDALGADAGKIAEQNLRAAVESAKLLDAFTIAAIPTLFVKGLTVSKLAYGDAFLKMSQDIDVLVPEGAVGAAASELETLGYRLTTPAVAPQSASFRRWHVTRKESLWRSPGGLLLELHSRLADNPHLIPGIDTSSPRQQVEIAPGLVLPTLAADELFTYLCVHGGTSAWFRLKWITDLAALMEHRSEAEIERLYERSQQLGAGRCAAQALLLATQLYGTAVGEALVRRLERDPLNRWLTWTAMQQLLRDTGPTEVRFGTVMIHASQLVLIPGMLPPFRELSRKVRDVLG